MGTKTGKPANKKSIPLIALAVILTIIATQNLQTVNMNILFWDIDMALLLLMGITFFCGFLAGYLLHTVKSKKPAASSPEDSQNAVEKKKKKLFGKNS